MSVPENELFFSIVIPAYNVMSHGMTRCLESIWKQAVDKELYEVICVDNLNAYYLKELGFEPFVKAGNIQ